MDVSCLLFMYITGLFNECCTHKSQHRCTSVFEFHNFLSFCFVIFWTGVCSSSWTWSFFIFNRSILLIIKKEKKVTSHNIVVEAILCDNLVHCHVSLELPWNDGPTGIKDCNLKKKKKKLSIH